MSNNTQRKDGTETKVIAYVDDRIVMETVPSEVKEEEKHPLAETLTDFMQRIDDIYFAVSAMVPASAEILKRRANKLNKKLKDSENKIKTGTPAEAAAAGAMIVDVTQESEKLYRSRLPQVVEQSLFVNLFSEYDFFFGTILRELYRRRPDLLASLSKQISFDELIKFENIDAIKNSVLEAEIDSIRRESYVEQFSILNKKFGLPLTKFQEWPDFVEAGQRRNLLVHCGGYVSDQYLQVCSAAGVRFESIPKVGDRLSIGQAYFEKSAGLISRVGFMLVHTLWRKVLPSECKDANEHINDQIYSLLREKRWQSSAELGNFSLSDPMLSGATDVQKRIRLINTAIALKNLKKTDEMKKIITSVDWSASVRDFRLAVCVINDEIDEAISMMKQIGKKGEMIHEIAYHQWPLFNSFREDQRFHQAYEEIYGYPFFLKAERSAEVARSKLEHTKDSPLNSEATEEIAIPKAAQPPEKKQSSQERKPRTAARKKAANSYQGHIDSDKI